LGSNRVLPQGSRGIHADEDSPIGWMWPLRWNLIETRPAAA